MFWGGGKKKEDEKEKQLKHLKAAFPSMRRPHNDDKLFELRFTVDNQFSTIRISVADDFPQIRPSYQVVGPVQHHWLDASKMVIGCRKLNEWNPKTSSILDTTEEILSAMLASRGRTNTPSDGTAQPQQTVAQPQQPLQQQQAAGGYLAPAFTNSVQPGVAPPPSLQAYGQQASLRQSSSQNYAQLNANPPASTGSLVGATVVPPGAGVSPLGVGLSQSSVSVQPAVQPPPPQANSYPTHVIPAPTPVVRSHSDWAQMAVPDVPTDFPDLERLTDVQLERLLKDTYALELHISAMESVQAMESLRDSQRETNSHSASSNIELGAEVQRLRREAQNLQQDIRIMYEELSKILQQVSQEDANERDRSILELKRAISALEEESDRLGDGLIQGTVDLLTFKSQYLDKRSKFYALSTRLQLAKASLPSPNSAIGTSGNGSSLKAVAAVVR